MLILCCIFAGCFLCSLFKGKNSVSCPSPGFPRTEPADFKSLMLYILLVIRSNEIWPLWFSKQMLEDLSFSCRLSSMVFCFSPLIVPMAPDLCWPEIWGLTPHNVSAPSTLFDVACSLQLVVEFVLPVTDVTAV